MKKLTRILSAMLALLLLISAMAFVTSCKKDGNETENTGSGNVTTDDSLPELEIKNLGGIDITILWPEVHSDGHYLHNEIAPDSEASNKGDVIDSAVHTRNLAVESAYNVNILSTTMFISDIAKTVRNEYGAGESSYSALACSINNSNMLALQQEGGLTDFNTLEYYDESQTWWNHELMKDLSVANARYFASGDIIYSDDFYPYCTYVSTEVVDRVGIDEDFYQLVKDNEWTLEKFHNLAVQVADGEIDGDPNTWSESDMNGAIINENFARAAYYSAGKGMISFDKAGYPIWQMEVARTQEILERVIDIVHKDNACLNTGALDGNHAEREINLFTSGKGLFLVEELIISERITKSENPTDFKILPFPLYDENSEYTCILNDAIVISIPVMTENKDDVCLVLSAMSRESVNTVTPAFFDTVLTYRYMKDEGSVETLETILDSTVPKDIATIQDWGGFMAQFKLLAMSESTNFSSFHGQNIGKAMGKLEEYCLMLDKYYDN